MYNWFAQRRSLGSLVKKASDTSKGSFFSLFHGCFLKNMCERTQGFLLSDTSTGVETEERYVATQVPPCGQGGRHDADKPVVVKL